MPLLKPAGSIIDLTLDEPDDALATATKVRAQAKALTADSSIEILDALPPIHLKPHSKKRARTPALQESDASPGKRRKTEAGHRIVLSDASIIELLDDDAPVASASKTLNAVASSSRTTQTLAAHVSVEVNIPSPTTLVYDSVDLLSACTTSDEELARRLAEEEVASHAADEELARRIMEEEQRQYLESLPSNPHDEALARKLFEEEQREQERLRKAVDAKQEGIVYRVSVNVADGTLEDGSPAHPDDLARFEPWRQKLENSGIQVKRFHWIVNYELEKKFEGSRELLEIVTGEPPQEQHLFHGTRQANIDSILSSGFRIGGIGNHKVINGTAFGTGIYLATSAQTSMQYAPDADRIFACRVLPGRTTPQPMHGVPPSTVPGTEEFESYCGPNGIYVVRYATLVLPCYMIEFERRGYGMGYPGPFIGAGIGMAGMAGIAAPGRFGMPMVGGMPMAGPALLHALRARGPPAGLPLYPPGYAGALPVPRPLAPAPRGRKGKVRLR
ncbi:unnamed protein product [Peniophora sp. CBMAI 1063]|nr:unnamed protein product [Peniophora sp. CBMAI 1063]